MPAATKTKAIVKAAKKYRIFLSVENYRTHFLKHPQFAFQTFFPSHLILGEWDTYASDNTEIKKDKQSQRLTLVLRAGQRDNRRKGRASLQHPMHGDRVSHVSDCKAITRRLRHTHTHTQSMLHAGKATDCPYLPVRVRH